MTLVPARKDGALIVEFVGVIAVTLAAGAGMVGLELAGAGDSAAAATLQSVATAGFGAVTALAYAARGVKVRDGN